MSIDAIRRHVPLRWLLAGAVVLTVGLTLSVVGPLIYFQVEGHLWRTGESRLRYQIESKWNRQPSMRVSPGTQRLPALPGFPGWAGDLARESSTADVFVRVLLPDGTVVASQGGPGATPPVDLDRVRAIGAALDAGKRGDGSYAVRVGSERWQVAYVPLYEGTRYLGLVEAAQSVRAADDLLAALARYLILSALVALAVGLGASSLVARAVAGPLEHLAATSRRVAAGDLDARTGLDRGRSELYAVSAAFDDMVSRLQTAFRDQRRFLADASHELKTPLTAIGGMAELLRSGAADTSPRERERALGTIEREVDRMSRLVHDLLALSRADQHPPLERQPVDLSHLAAEVAAEASQLSPHLAIHVANGAPVWTTGDREHLARALRNVLDNARQHTPPGGSVSVSCAAENGSVLVSVADTGSGIPAHHLPHVFERFYRADPSRSRRTGGSGLGLSIVRSIAEWHDGAVSIHSAEDRGTTVTLRLPAAGNPSPDS